LVIDRVSQRVAVASSFQTFEVYRRWLGELRFLDTDTGAVLGGAGLAGFSDVHFDRESRRLVIVSRSEMTSPLPSCGPVVVYAFDGLSGSPVTTSSGSDMCALAAIASPPAAPDFQTPSVADDRTVTLSWTPPTGEVTTGFVVEAGSAPGLSNLAALEVPAGSTLTVPNVPSGSYYVRVRSRNDLGIGLPSNERRIDVP
jgi:hypothetical protein